MNIHLEQKVATRGYFSINVLDANGNDTGKGVTDSPNVVTHHGGRLAGQVDWGNLTSTTLTDDVYLGVGTGTVERTVDSTDLASEIAVSRGTVTNGTGTGFTDNLDGTETYKRVCKGSYPLGDVTETISEVGIYSGSGATLVAGQLIKDSNGNPTTITVLADEQLVVTYTIEWTYSKDTQPQTTGTVDVNGTSTTWTLKVPPVKTGDFYNYPSQGMEYSWQNTTTSLLLAGDGTVINSKGLETLVETPLSTGGTRYNFGTSWAPSEGAGDVAQVILGTDGNDTTNLSDPLVMASIEFSPAIPKTSSEVLTVEVSWDVVAV